MSILNLSYATQEEIPAGYDALYTERDGKFQLTGVTGMKTDADISNLQRALTNERTAHSATKNKFKQLSFNGKALAEMSDEELKLVSSELDGFEELKLRAENAGKLDDEKINKLVEGRVKTALSPVERAKVDLENQLKTTTEQLTSFQQKEKQRQIHDAVREARKKTKALEAAEDDILLNAERMLDVDETGQVVTKDGVGVTPGVAADVWLLDMQPKRPLWWEASVGGGAKGNNGRGGGDGKVMKRSQFDAMNPQAKMDYSKNGGQVVD